MNAYNLDFLNVKNVCLIGHINPDVDALASMIVLKAFISKQFNVENIDLFADFTSLPKNYNALIDGVTLNPKRKTYDVVIMLDSPNSSRLGIYQNLFDGAKKKVVIDHHFTNNFSGDVNIVEYVSSTCEIVYSILKQYKYNLSSSECAKIYAGIITDTNNLTVGEISSKTYKIISEMYNKFDAKSVYLQYFSSNSLKTMNILAKAIENIEDFENGSIIFSYITKKQSKMLQLEANDVNGIVNWLSTIENSKFVCFIYPNNNNYYVSLRAKQGFDVAKIAKENGGGGHVGAAAFTSKKSIAQIKELLITMFKNQL